MPVSDSVTIPPGVNVKKRFFLKSDKRFVVECSFSIISGNGFNDNSDIFAFGPWFEIGKVLQSQHKLTILGGYITGIEEIQKNGGAIYYGKYPSKDIFAGGGISYSPILNLGDILLFSPEIFTGFWNAKQKVIAYDVHGEWIYSDDEMNSYLFGGIGFNCSAGFRRVFLTGSYRLFLGTGIYHLRSPLMGITLYFRSSCY